MNIYVDYVTRLWDETNTKSRERIANQKAYHAIKQVQHLLQEGQEYGNIMNNHDGDTLDDIEKKSQARSNLLNSCNVMLDILGPIEKDVGLAAAETATDANNGVKNSDDDETQLLEIVQSQTSNTEENPNEKAIAISSVKEKKTPKKKKQSRSVLFGASMGAIVACWVFSGNFLFTSLFTLMTILGQLEYYRMVMRVGIYQARKISVVGACAMFVTVS